MDTPGEEDRTIDVLDALLSGDDDIDLYEECDAPEPAAAASGHDGPNSQGECLLLGAWLFRCSIHGVMSYPCT